MNAHAKPSRHRPSGRLGILGTAVSQVFFAAFAVRRLRDARRTGDVVDVVDAAANMLVVVTGTLVLVRQLRKEH